MDEDTKRIVVYLTKTLTTQQNVILSLTGSTAHIIESLQNPFHTEKLGLAVAELKEALCSADKLDSKLALLQQEVRRHQ